MSIPSKLPDWLLEAAGLSRPRFIALLRLAALTVPVTLLVGSLAGVPLAPGFREWGLRLTCVLAILWFTATERG